MIVTIDFHADFLARGSSLQPELKRVIQDINTPARRLNGQFQGSYDVMSVVAFVVYSQSIGALLNIPLHLLPSSSARSAERLERKSGIYTLERYY